MPSERPSHEVVSNVTQSNSYITPNTQKSPVTFIQTKTYSQDRTDVIEKRNIRIPPAAGPYVIIVHFDNGPHDVASFLPMAIYIASRIRTVLRRMPY